jgi:hypothetical protein
LEIVVVIGRSGGVCGQGKQSLRGGSPSVQSALTAGLKAPPLQSRM